MNETRFLNPTRSLASWRALLLTSVLMLLVAACGDETATKLTQPGADVGGGVDVGNGDTGEPDVERDTGEEPGLGMGAICSSNSECESGDCRTFGDQSICSDTCTDTCGADGLVCHEGVCTPEDYCSDGNGPGCPPPLGCEVCHEDANCIGGGDEEVSCVCAEGFDGDGFECQDIDECADPDLNTCDEAATCTNTPGGYTCECAEGYESDGGECVDIDECADADLNTCDGNAACTNTPGGFTCECDDGFEGDGFACVDVDECADADLNGCDENATCSNTPGGYVCGCDAGFQGNGFDCQDIDECADPDLNDCDANATCNNTLGSYTCECVSGYEGDGLDCQDVDECADANLNACDANATCSNNAGSYDCECNEWYEGNGFTCTDVARNITGARTPDDPGTWADGTHAVSCQEYRDPLDPLFAYEGSTGDGFYVIEPPGSQGPTVVFCDMTTDGGGWTGIDPATANELFGADMTTLGGSGCTMEGDRPQAFTAGTVKCRFDFELGIEFNVMRTMNVEIVALAGASQTADLTYYAGDWGDMICDSRGDVLFGTPAHSGGALSLGRYEGFAECATGPQFSNGTSLFWDDDLQFTTRDTVLRLEMGESGGQLEGWRWESGYIFVRNDIEVEGELTVDDPGIFENGTVATSCEEYRRPAQGYVENRVDGFYVIDPDGDGPAQPVTVYCDMNTGSGGWMGVNPAIGSELFGVDMTTLDGPGCSLDDGRPQGVSTGLVQCRFDFELGIEFNVMRTSGVRIRALAGASQTADLTYYNGPWGEATCGSRGDVLFGTPAHPGATLSLGAFRNVSQCGSGPEFSNNSFLNWDGDEQFTTRDTVLRLELGENGSQFEGWQWDSGYILVRNDVEISGALTADDPGVFEDDTIATSCETYRRPGVGYMQARVDGFYRIDPDGDGPIAAMTVYCDMTRAGGGWTQIAHVRRLNGMPYPGRDVAGGDVNELGYSINATGIAFGEIALTHNGLQSGNFATFTLANPTVWNANLADIRFPLSNGRWAIFALSEGSSGGWGDIPLTCINASRSDCLQEGVRNIAFGAVATGGGDCHNLGNSDSGTATSCGSWGLSPNAGNTTWTRDGGRVFLR